MNKEQKIEQFIKTYSPTNIFKSNNPFLELLEKPFCKDLKSLMDSAVEEKLQEKLNDYDVGSLEYKIIKSMLEE